MGFQKDEYFTKILLSYIEYQLNHCLTTGISNGLVCAVLSVESAH